MNTPTTQYSQEYKGFLIEEEDCPWAKKTGSLYKFQRIDGDGRVYTSDSVNGAKHWIDDMMLREAFSDVE